MGVAAGGTPDLRMAAPITFLLFKCSNLTMNHAAPDASCTANSVSASGLAACTLPSLSFDNWTAIVQLGTVASPGNTDFAAPRSDLVVATVYQPTSDKFAAGGGFVIDPSYQNKPVAISMQNNHGHFGFNVRYKSATTPSGQLVYTFRRADGYDYIVKSNSWQGPGLAFGTNTAGFNGKCGVAVIDPRTGQIVTGLGDRQPQRCKPERRQLDRSQSVGSQPQQGLPHRREPHGRQPFGGQPQRRQGPRRHMEQHRLPGR